MCGLQAAPRGVQGSHISLGDFLLTDWALSHLLGLTPASLQTMADTEEVPVGMQLEAHLLKQLFHLPLTLSPLARLEYLG